MAADHRTSLASISRFDQLVAYLQNELGWPIATDDFDDLTFDYTPQELGINDSVAARILSIRRLRPLVPNQPWGIFFVEFEPKRLPVVALRRILSRVVIKKRTTASSADNPAWQLQDLMFISSYGEVGERKLSLAHFTQDREMGDLPTLRVLGWDGDDTELHLEHADKELRTKLRWPKDSANAQAWRNTWSLAFTLRHREVVTTSKRLAEKLAELARAIRRKANEALAIETAAGPMRTLMAGFQKALIHDLKEDDFADMYAQTIAYGLLSASISRPAGLIADNMPDMVPVTSPFLKELLETFVRMGGRHREGKADTGIDFDELGINEVVQLLRDAKMEAVVRDFGDRNPEEDPVIHFYELFLKEYDAKKRMQRGVFYTPRPVVSYIVRSVHELLKTEFGLEDGLADTATWGEVAQRVEGLTIPDEVKADDPFVTILDPAAGTGTFLVEVIDLIHRTLMAKWEKQGHSANDRTSLWNEYVPQHLLPRVHGYELLMAPYAIAHMKVGLKLQESGYLFRSTEPVRVFLTNSMEPAHDFSGQFEFAIPALAHESKSVTLVKERGRFTVIVGNPPYSGHSANKGAWARHLVERYKTVDGHALRERNPKWLQDDYAKFVAFGQWCIENAGQGVLGFITNHSYLDSPTFRGMRRSLMSSFSQIRILNLHGNTKRKEKVPSADKDENVFDIQQGVAISIYVKWPSQRSATSVRYADTWGPREFKYAILMQPDAGDTIQTELQPDSPFYLFVPVPRELATEYQDGWKITDIFPVNVLGFQTHRDKFAIDFEEEGMRRKVVDLRERTYSDEEIRDLYGLRDNRDWQLSVARNELRADDSWEQYFVKCVYRPFDSRYCYLNTAVMDYPRWQVMRNLLRGSIALLLPRGVGASWRHAFVSSLPAVDVAISAASREANQVFPLYLYHADGEIQFADGHRRPNLSPVFIEAVSNEYGLEFVEDGTGDLERTFGPADIFNYVYSVLHSCTYRTRYAEFLKIDFPRVPFSTSHGLFKRLVEQGRQLVAIHLMETPVLATLVATYPIVGPNTVDKPSYWEDSRRVYINSMQYLEGVPPDVWAFHIGGYQVCEKWLKDRKGRTLTADDITHYCRIIAAISETIRIMQEIDEVIDAHGGWPGAFQATSQDANDGPDTRTPERQQAMGEEHRRHDRKTLRYGHV